MKTQSKVTIAFIILNFSFVCFAQRKDGIEYKLNIDKLKTTKEIIWYGVDFSKCKITDGKKINEGNVIQIKTVEIPKWNTLLDNNYDSKILQAKLLKDKFTEDYNSIQKLCQKINESELLSGSKYDLTIDSIKSFVRNYNLPQKSGVGLVLIVENLNTPENYVSGYFTFFDISTKEILYAVRMKEDRAHDSYFKGIELMFNYFFRVAHGNAN